MQESILRFFQSIQSPALDTFFTYVTMLGEQYFIILIVAWIYWNHSKKEGFILTFLFIVSNMVNTLMKAIFHTQRPFQKLDNFEAQRVHTAEGHSFPSGHTQASSTLFFSLIMIFKNRTFAIIAVFLALLVATSRMYLGVHWPIDVIGGLFFAAILVFLLYNYLYRLYDEQKKFFRLITLVLIIFAVIVLVMMTLNEFYLTEKIDLKNYFRLLGVSVGAVMGFIFEEKKYPFSVKAQRPLKWIRFVLGMAGTIGLLVGLKYVLPDNFLGVLIRYFLVGAWISGIYPILGQMLKLFKKQ